MVDNGDKAFVVTVGFGVSARPNIAFVDDNGQSVAHLPLLFDLASAAIGHLPAELPAAGVHRRRSKEVIFENILAAD
jgi:hypothetical protein